MLVVKKAIGFEVLGVYSPGGWKTWGSKPVSFVRSPMLVDVCRPERLAWERCLARAQDPVRGRYADALVSYLARFPVGLNNRAAAERLEELIFELRHVTPLQAAHLSWVLRSLREPYMPPMRADTWTSPCSRPGSTWELRRPSTQPPPKRASMFPGSPA